MYHHATNTGRMATSTHNVEVRAQMRGLGGKKHEVGHYQVCHHRCHSRNPPLHNVGEKKILVETSNKAAHHQPYGIQTLSTPFGVCYSVVGGIEQRGKPHNEVSTTSQFGTRNGVLRCSMSPQGFIYAPRVVQGGGFWSPVIYNKRLILIERAP